jgi:chorismate-pyruvate lyase
MKAPPRITRPDLGDLFTQFGAADDLPDYEIIPGRLMPQPYRKLLVHEHHMTVTVEAHHGDLVDVRILTRRHVGNSYARKILLTLQKTGRIVQFGIVRIDLAQCSQAVRDALIEGKTPVGRILIQHNVLRRIEPTAFLRIQGGPAQMAWFGLTEPRTLYGRLAFIHCDGKPAVELVEIVAPE